MLEYAIGAVEQGTASRFVAESAAIVTVLEGVSHSVPSRVDLSPGLGPAQNDPRQVGGRSATSVIDEVRSTQMKSSEPQVQVHPLRGGLTTQQITSRDPAFSKLRTESREISFRQICPEVPDTTYLTHGIHPYPAKFIPQIPRHFIKTQTEPGDVVLDPFAGSGTALVESAMLSRHSIGATSTISRILWDVKTNFSDEVSAWGFAV